MAIALQCINLIIPIALIQEKYSGGWEQSLKDHAALIGGRVWYDQQLFRDGAMNHYDMGELVAEWEGYGFQPKESRSGQEVFKDLCIVTSIFGATLPCNWLSYSEDGGSVYLTGTPPGPVAGPDWLLSSQDRSGHTSS